MTTQLALAVLCLPLCLSPAPAQPAGKQAHVFRGKVVEVSPAARRITVAGEPVEGWMGAMTMAYPVDSQDVLNGIKAGDQITAEVYDGDLTLYRVQVVARGAAPATAASQSGLRLEDLERMALAANPTLAQAEANQRAAAALARQAGLYPNPTLGYYGDEIRGGSIGGGKQGGFVSQTIVLGGKLHAARRVAELQAAEVATSAQAQRLRVLNNVRAFFYQALAAERLVEVSRNLDTLATDSAETAHQLANVGQADRPDVLQAEVEQQQAAMAVRVAQQSLLASWRMLAAVAGKPGLPLSPLQGDLEAVPALDYQEWLAATLSRSPQIQLAQQAVERAEASLVYARKAPIPDLQVTGTLVQSYEPLARPGSVTGVQAGGQIGVQLPVFNRNRGSIAAARDEIASANQELARRKLELERGLAGLFRDYDAARVSVQQYQTEMLPRAQEAYKLYQANYQAMAGAYAQVLISQRTLFHLEADYIQQLANAWQSALAIQGFGLMDGLAAPLAPVPVIP
jgi:cobalt-zinc-cadmium efflux system outer membrane protein